MNDKKLQIRHENGKVLYLFNGTPVFGGAVPREVARLIAKESTRCAALADELCEANRIIMDNAILQRSGANIGISIHPKIVEETVKEALHNTELRKAMPYQKNSVGIGNIKTRGSVGSPSFIKRAVQ